MRSREQAAALSAAAAAASYRHAVGRERSAKLINIKAAGELVSLCEGAGGLISLTRARAAPNSASARHQMGEQICIERLALRLGGARSLSPSRNNCDFSLALARELQLARPRGKNSLSGWLFEQQAI